jgi:glycosyltransferase involved in cell wall biosynthesis
MIIAFYYEQNDYGGVDTHMAHLFNHWPSNDDQFLVLSNPNNDGIVYLKSMLKKSNVKFFEINDGIFSKNGICGNKFLKLLLFIKIQFIFLIKFPKILSNFKPDIFISNNGGYPGAITSFIAAIIGRLYRPTKSKTFFLIHHAPCGNFFDRKFADIYSVLIRLLSINIITVSEASKKALESETPLEKIKFIHNGLEMPPQSHLPMSLKTQLNISNDRLIIGIIGPIDPHKGHDTILQAFKSSNFLQKHAHFVVVGKGRNDLVKSLKAKVQNYGLGKNITFTGFLPGDSLNIISAFDIMVMPTIDFEGFGYSMAEAMATGVPVIASNIGALPEVIEHNISGLLVEPFNIQSWTESLEKMVSKPKMRKTIGNAGKLRIQKYFLASKMSQSYHDLIKE